MKKIWFLVFFFLGTVPLLMFAQSTPVADTDPSTPGSVTDPSTPKSSGIPVKLENPLQFGTLEQLLIAILNIIMVLMIPVIVFFIIYAGFKYVTARGNASTIEEATRALTYAIIGAVIILGAVAISAMIKNTVDEFKAKPPTTYLHSPALTYVSTNFTS